MGISLALDTGASKTCISPSAISYVGHDIEAAKDFAELTTGNGTIRVPSLSILGLRCLGQTNVDFSIHAMAFPSKLGIVGLLGLDFLKNRRLCIDYRDGTVELL